MLFQCCLQQSQRLHIILRQTTTKIKSSTHVLTKFEFIVYKCSVKFNYEANKLILPCLSRAQNEALVNLIFMSRAIWFTPKINWIYRHTHRHRYQHTQSKVCASQEVLASSELFSIDDWLIDFPFKSNWINNFML